MFHQLSPNVIFKVLPTQRCPFSPFTSSRLKWTFLFPYLGKIVCSSPNIWSSLIINIMQGKCDSQDGYSLGMSCSLWSTSSFHSYLSVPLLKTCALDISTLIIGPILICVSQSLYQYFHAANNRP